MQQLLIIILVGLLCNTVWSGDEEVNLKFHDGADLSSTMRCKNSVLQDFSLIQMIVQQNKEKDKDGDAYLFKLESENFVDAVFCIKDLFKLAELEFGEVNKETKLHNNNVLELLWYVDYFGGNQVLPLKLIRSIPLHIVETLEPYFLDTQKKLPDYISSEKAKEYFLVALPFLPDEQKKLQARKWYERQYTNKEFKAMDDYLTKRHDTPERSGGNYIVYTWIGTDFKASNDLWEQSFERCVYKKIITGEVPTLDSMGQHYRRVKKVTGKDAYGDAVNLFKSEMTFLHVPLLSLAMRMRQRDVGVVESDDIKGVLFKNEQPGYLTAIDIEHMAVIGSFYKHVEAELLLQNDVQIPWKAFNFFASRRYWVGVNLFKQRLRDPFAYQKPVFKITYEANGNQSHTFDLKVPYTGSDVKDGALPFVFPGGWYLLNRYCVSPWYTAFLKKADDEYIQALHAVSNTIPEKIRAIWLYLSEPEYSFLHIPVNPIKHLYKVPAILPLLPQFTGNRGDITLDQVMQAREALKSLFAISKLNGGFFSWASFFSIWGQPLCMYAAVGWYAYRIGCQNIRTQNWMSTDSNNILKPALHWYNSWLPAFLGDKVVASISINKSIEELNAQMKAQANL